MANSAVIKIKIFNINYSNLDEKYIFMKIGVLNVNKKTVIRFSDIAYFFQVK